MLRKFKLQLLLSLTTIFFFFSCSQWVSKERVSTFAKNDFPRFDVHKKVLPNGLTLLFVQRSKVPVFGFYNYVKVGSHYETKGITGSAHFLEHLMFLGGKKYPAGEFDNVMASNGGSSNASTSYDLTIYHEDLPIHAIDKILDMESDRLLNLAFDDKAFEKERNVILEERKMRLENSPQGQILNETLSQIYKNTPYEEAIIGSIPDIKNVSKQEIHDFFKKYYVPNNMVMVVVGDFKKEKIFEKLESHFGKLVKNEKYNLEEQKKEFDHPDKYKTQLTADQKIQINGNSKNPIFFLAINAHGTHHRKSVMLDLISTMMSYGKSSFLYQNFVTGPQAKLTYVHAMNYALNNAGIFVISGQLLEGKNPQQIDQVEKELKNKLAEFCTQVITPRNVTKTKNQFLVSYYEGLQKTSEIAELIGKYEATFGDYSYYIKEIEMINSASVEELQSVCHEFMVEKKKLFVSLWDQHPRKK